MCSPDGSLVILARIPVRLPTLVDPWAGGRLVASASADGTAAFFLIGLGARALARELSAVEHSGAAAVCLQIAAQGGPLVLWLVGGLGPGDCVCLYR